MTYKLTDAHGKTLYVGAAAIDVIRASHRGASDANVWIGTCANLYPFEDDGIGKGNRHDFMKYPIQFETIGVSNVR